LFRLIRVFAALSATILGPTSPSRAGGGAMKDRTCTRNKRAVGSRRMRREDRIVEHLPSHGRRQAAADTRFAASSLDGGRQVLPSPFFCVLLEITNARAVQRRARDFFTSARSAVSKTRCRRSERHQQREVFCGGDAREELLSSRDRAKSSGSNQKRFVGTSSRTTSFPLSRSAMAAVSLRVGDLPHPSSRIQASWPSDSSSA